MIFAILDKQILGRTGRELWHLWSYQDRDVAWRTRHQIAEGILPGDQLSVALFCFHLEKKIVCDFEVIRFQIGNNDTAPGIFIDAGIHAREWIAPATALYILNQVRPVCSLLNFWNNLVLKKKSEVSDERSRTRAVLLQIVFGWELACLWNGKKKKKRAVRNFS